MRERSLKPLILGATIIFFLISIFLPIRLGAARSSQTLTVPDDYPTIQAAINASNPEATVFVRTGIYHEHVTLNKPLTLRGETAQSTTIDGDKTDGNVVSIVASNVTLSNLTIRNSQVGFAGVRVDNVRNCTISGSYVVNNWYGILIHQCLDTNVTDNNVRNNADGIHIESFSGNDVVTENAVIDQTFFGVHLISSSNITVATNNVSNTAYGIYLDSSSNVQILQNNASYNGYGLFLDTSSSNEAIGNSVTGNDICGVYFYGYSSNNGFYNNGFAANKQQVNGTGGQENAWDNGIRGNYWSDYLAKYPNATEVGNSGFYAIPYVVDADNTDHHPLISYTTVPEFSLPAFLFLIIPLFLVTIVFLAKKGMSLKNGNPLVT